MNAVQIEAKTETKTSSKTHFRFPHGILGFENVKKYCFFRQGPDSPFFWLQMMEGPELAFLLIPSVPYFPEYNPDICKEDLSLLQIQNPQDATMFNIVTLHNEGGATANLKGPVILNRDNQIGAQFVAKNAADFAVSQALTD